jgi:hypothetical protein
MINLRQAAKQLRRSASWVRAQVADGKLQVTPQGRQKLVSEGELARFARAEHLDLLPDPTTLRLDLVRQEVGALSVRLERIEQQLAGIEAAVARMETALRSRDAR